MNKVLASFFLFVCAPGPVASPQERQPARTLHPLPYGDQGKQYSVARPGFAYPREFGSLEEIDVRNFVLHSFEGRRHWECGQPRNGYWESRYNVGMSSLRLVGVHQLPAAEGRAQFMLILFEYPGIGGSSDSTGFA